MSLVIYEVCKIKPEKRTHYGIEVFLNKEDAVKHLRSLNRMDRIRLARQYRKDYFEAQRIENEICTGAYKIIERIVET